MSRRSTAGRTKRQSRRTPKQLTDFLLTSGKAEEETQEKMADEMKKKSLRPCRAEGSRDVEADLTYIPSAGCGGAIEVRIAAVVVAAEQRALSVKHAETLETQPHTSQGPARRHHNQSKLPRFWSPKGRQAR